MKICERLLLIALLYTAGVQAQETFPVNGVRDEDRLHYAFVNVTLVVDPYTVIDGATLLIRDGLIVAAGKQVTVPMGAVVYDLSGKRIYPSFIDAYSSYGMPVPEKGGRPSGPQHESARKGPFAWNQALQPETNAAALFSVRRQDAEKLRMVGFGAVNAFHPDGIARGTSVLVSLADRLENAVVMEGRAAAHLSFDKGTSQQSYPSSLMGSIALLRQTYLDGQWYRNSRTEYNVSLEAWNNLQNLPQIFEAADKLSALRADRLGDEFGVQYVIKGGGGEYQRVEEIRKTGATFIIPLDFPAAFDVTDPYDAMLVTLAEMKHWEMAPCNAATLEKNGVPFALTAYGLKDTKQFLANLRKAIECGLSEQQALNALTLTPARILRVSYKLGDLKAGKIANFLITSGNLFDKNTVIYENWVQGRRYMMADYNEKDIRGTWSLTVDGKTAKLKIAGRPGSLKGTMQPDDSTRINAKVSREGALVTVSFEAEKGSGNLTRLSGAVTGDSALTMRGDGQLAGGRWVSWLAVRTKGHDGKEKPEDDDTTRTESPASGAGDAWMPPMAYGRTQAPARETVLIRNTTVWTNTEKSILQQADVLLRDGKIVAVGKMEAPPGAKVIDGTGKHVTPGIIDEHSHIAASRGINEAAQSVSAEVRIGDVINPEDINIYRQLAGGVTAAQILHGSANPIGGQSGLIKLRWGASAEEMKIGGADGFIKFALGENVKWSNRSDNFNDRFPQTRMGVEQVYYDAFIRAKEYDTSWKKYRAAKDKAAAPRRDLELETLAEILNGKRFISCHSYVQSEINMLMHVADSMGFRVNTFTHILEGYKVADKMHRHGAGGSTFADWWAYKFEVKDAIPHNAALMHRAGVVTAVNSDDAEMARRLNQEAAKSVKYAGLSEEEALKFVTLNPAKLLHLDHRMGSIKEGMDADVVIWSDNPLSVYARAEKTYVDGKCYYDSEEDARLREAIRQERDRLIRKMLAAKNGGEKTRKPEQKEEMRYDCETTELDY